MCLRGLNHYFKKSFSSLSPQEALPNIIKKLLQTSLFEHLSKIFRSKVTCFRFSFKKNMPPVILLWTYFVSYKIFFKIGKKHENQMDLHALFFLDFSPTSELSVFHFAPILEFIIQLGFLRRRENGRGKDQHLVKHRRRCPTTIILQSLGTISQ